MSTENVKKFEEAIQSEPAVQAEVKAIIEAAGPDQADKLAALSRDLGFPITAQELQAAWNGSELSDQELESVAGGYTMPKINLPRHLLYITIPKGALGSGRPAVPMPDVKVDPELFS